MISCRSREVPLILTYARTYVRSELRRNVTTVILNQKRGDASTVYPVSGKPHLLYLQRDKEPHSVGDIATLQQRDKAEVGY